MKIAERDHETGRALALERSDFPPLFYMACAARARGALPAARRHWAPVLHASYLIVIGITLILGLVSQQLLVNA